MPYVRYNNKYAVIGNKRVTSFPRLILPPGVDASTSGDYVYVTVNSSTNIEFGTSATIDILLVGGGAGSDSQNAAYGNISGGAGGGKVVEQFSKVIAPGIYSLIVGNGGLAGNNTGDQHTKFGQAGLTTSAFGIDASGAPTMELATPFAQGGAAAGGLVGGNSTAGTSGGGGGNSTHGGSGKQVTGHGGSGGLGSLSVITGLKYGGGGGGFSSTDGYFAPGNDGGGHGNFSNGSPIYNEGGTPNTGGGAGACYWSSPALDGKAGGSGVIVFRYKYK